MNAPATRFGDILRVLAKSEVRFILVGGLAAIAHGTERATLDVDVVYDRSDDNLALLALALEPYQPYLRGAPPGLPFSWDERTIRVGLNFTLSTTLGALDLFGEIAGGGTYAALLPFSEEIQIFDITCRCVTLERLIQLKLAAGRPKDLEALAELQALLEDRDRLDSPDLSQHIRG